jgi:glycosyltransferase involved in cell wall biosynthesis
LIDKNQCPESDGEGTAAVTTTLSVVIPCFNEAATLTKCVARVRAIASQDLAVEIVIVDDASTDDSLARARALADRHSEIKVYSHESNKGKGAALRTGFGKVSGDFVAVQDADLEYDPNDLVRLLEPLIAGKADVAFGSRYLSTGPHRVLYFWHSIGNQFLTLISNIFTDLNLTDMETCYKVFKREVIQSIEIEENRFGFEPEIVAKLADRRLRIYEMGITYDGRTYEEGKKIGVSDAFRALYCILRYNARSAPIAIQFVLYLLIGGVAALANLALFGSMHAAGMPLIASVPAAFGIAAILNYLLCVTFLFHRNARWQNIVEWSLYALVVVVLGTLDYAITRWMIDDHFAPITAKAIATILLPVLNFAGRRFLVFPSPKRGPWEAGQNLDPNG